MPPASRPASTAICAARLRFAKYCARIGAGISVLTHVFHAGPVAMPAPQYSAAIANTATLSIRPYNAAAISGTKLAACARAHSTTHLR